MQIILILTFSSLMIPSLNAFAEEGTSIAVTKFEVNDPQLLGSGFSNLLLSELASIYDSNM